jgi:hypothetical protein
MRTSTVVVLPLEFQRQRLEAPEPRHNVAVCFVPGV